MTILNLHSAFSCVQGMAQGSASPLHKACVSGWVTSPGTCCYITKLQAHAKNHLYLHAKGGWMELAQPHLPSTWTSS